MPITTNDLDQILANNPALRVKCESYPVKYYVVTRRIPGGALAMVHREGCAILRRATHAKERDHNPIATDKFNFYQPHSCLTPKERIPAPVPRQSPLDGKARQGGIKRPAPQKRLSSDSQNVRRDYKSELLQQIALAGLPAPVSEYRFHATRKWRWDFAFVTQKVAVEYQGGIYHSGKQGHQTTAGIERDCLKFSEGAALGWRLLPINAGMVRDGTALNLIERALA